MRLLLTGRDGGRIAMLHIYISVAIQGTCSTWRTGVTIMHANPRGRGAESADGRYIDV